MSIILINSRQYKAFSPQTGTPRMDDGAMSVINATERKYRLFLPWQWTVRRNRKYNCIVLRGSHTRRVRDANSSRLMRVRRTRV